MSQEQEVRKISMNELEFVQQIGAGSFSTVYKMVWTADDACIEVAAKKLVTPTSQELEIISKLEHPNIVKLLGVVDEGITFLLILEFCEGGSLRSYLNKVDRIPRKQFYEWAKQAAIPLGYLKDNKVVHKDVKSANYLITKDDTLKLSDFGLSRIVDGTMSNATGTASYPWMAPELLETQTLSASYDIHSYGVVVWELWTGSYPYEGLGCANIIMKVCKLGERLLIPMDCPREIADLMAECWNQDWNKRPSIKHILKVLEKAEAAAQQDLEEEALNTHDEQEVEDDASSEPATPEEPAPVTPATPSQYFISGPWQLLTRFGVMTCPIHHITQNPNGDIAVVDCHKGINIYTTLGAKKYTTMCTYEPKKSETHLPRQIAASSDGMWYFVTNVTEFVHVYTNEAVFVRQWSSRGPDLYLPAPYLWGITMDSNRDLLLGDIKSMYINKHMEDGLYLGSIKIGIQPRFLATTPHDTIVIADWYEPPQIISQTGEVLHTFAHPRDDPYWNLNPQGACCYGDIVLVPVIEKIEGHDGDEKTEILCYSLSGEYQGCLPITNASPVCATKTGDGTILIVGSECQGCSLYLLPKGTLYSI